jgi:hypothetical protein
MRVGWYGEKVTERTSDWVSCDARCTHRSVKDKLWSLEQVQVPDRYNSIWVVHCCGILVVRSDHEFLKLALAGSVDPEVPLTTSPNQ